MPSSNETRTERHLDVCWTCFCIYRWY